METNNVEPQEEVYTINELLNNYSLFTRYNINKSIIEKGLPYFNIGSKKYFKKSEIDNWIKNQTGRNNFEVNENCMRL